MILENAIVWKKFNFETCSLRQSSKEHYTANNITTYCGVLIPSRHEADLDGLGERSYVNCKKCQKVFDKNDS